MTGDGLLAEEAVSAAAGAEEEGRSGGERPPAEPPEDLWANRDFRVFLGGQIVSAMGNGVTFTALPLLVILLTRSGTDLGIVGALQTFPNLAFGLVAGSLADRWDRRRIMLWSDLGRGVLIGAIPLAWALHVPVMPVVFAVTAPIALLTSSFLAAYSAAIPSLSGRENLGRATAYLQGAFAVGFVVGPGLAAGLIALVGPARTLGLDSLSFLVSGLSLLAVRRPLQTGAAGRAAGIVASVREALRFVRGQPTLRTILLFWACVSGVNVLLIPAAAFFVEVDRGMSPSTFGYVVSVYSLGAVVGFGLAGRASGGRLGIPILAGNLVSGAAIALLLLTHGLALLLADAFAAGAAMAFVTALYVTLRSSLTPDALLGRIGSLSEVATDTLTPVGMLAGGALLDLTSGGATLLTMGLALAFFTLAFSTSSHFRHAGAAGHEAPR